MLLLSGTMLSALAGGQAAWAQQNERHDQQHQQKQEQKQERQQQRQEQKAQQKPAQPHQQQPQQKQSQQQQKQERQEQRAQQKQDHQQQRAQQPQQRHDQKQQSQQKPAPSQPSRADTQNQQKPAAGQPPREHSQQKPAPSPSQAQTKPQREHSQQKPAQAPSQAQTKPAPAAPQAQTKPAAPAAPQAPAQAQTKPQSPPAAQAQPQRAHRLDDLRKERRETKEGNRTIIREGDRTIVRQNNRTIIRHDEVGRFRIGIGPGGVKVERQGAETRTVINRPNGVQIVNVTDAHGRLVRRIRRDHGRDVVIIDNRPRGGRTTSVILNLKPPVIRIPRDRYIVEATAAPALLYETLEAPPVEHIERAYTLDEIRDNPNLRARMRRVDLDTITFDTGSWEVAPSEAARLEPIAHAMKQAIAKNNAEVFLVEGHTDAVGDEVDNLTLSDRRAEAVAVVLTEQFGIPPENLTTQGYGEQQLKVQTEGAERQNRRVSVRRITPLLAGNNSGATGNGG
jgi:outer membrane protein OmpA-like peptidoglycan-associated protein